MVSITKRRINKSGGSKTVALPPDWLDAMGLSKGDDVQVIYDDVVVVKPLYVKVDPESVKKELEALNRRLTQN
jgi:antitoxin component of MazEF toxin-antitoxin module